MHMYAVSMNDDALYISPLPGLAETMHETLEHRARQVAVWTDADSVLGQLTVPEQATALLRTITSLESDLAAWKESAGRAALDTGMSARALASLARVSQVTAREWKNNPRKDPS